MSNEIEKMTFLKEAIKDRLKNANERRVYFRKRAFYTYMSVAILGAVTTILLGLNIDPLKEYVRIIALILSAVVTLINVHNAFFNYKELWIANNTAVNRFYQLQFNIDYIEKDGAKLQEDVVDAFKKNYQDILDELNTTWQKSRTVNNRPS